VKWPGCEAGHIHPSGAEVKHAENCTSSLQYACLVQDEWEVLFFWGVTQCSRYCNIIRNFEEPSVFICKGWGWQMLDVPVLEYGSCTLFRNVGIC